MKLQLLISLSIALKFGVINKYPIASCTPSTFSGFIPELIDMIVENIGDKVENTEFICYDSFNSASKSLIQGDLHLSFLPMTPENHKNFTFSIPFLNNGLVIVAKNYKKSLFFTVYEPIQWKLWICLLVLPVILSHFYWFFERNREGGVEMEYRKGIITSLWQVFLGFFFMRREGTKKVSTRIIIISYWFIVFIISAGYIAALASRIGKFSRFVQVDHFQDLGDNLVGTYKEFAETLQNLGIKTVEYSQNSEKPYRDVVVDILDEKIAAGAFTFSEALMLNSEYCELSLLGSIFIDSYLGFAYPTGNGNTTLMNQFQLSLHDMLDEQIVKRVLNKNLLKTTSKKCSDGLDLPLPIELMTSSLAYAAAVTLIAVPIFIFCRKKLSKGRITDKDLEKTKTKVENEKEMLDFMNMMIKFECLLASSKTNFNKKFDELKERVNESGAVYKRFGELLKELEFRIENI